MLRRPGFLYLAAALVSQINTWLVAPEHDSAYWLYMALRQQHAEMPGRDLWDNKLPPIYLIGRVALATGAPLAALWLIESVLTASGALAVAATVRAAQFGYTKQRAAGSNAAASVLAGLLLCLASGLPAYRGGGYMTEVYAMPLSAAAALLVLRGLAGGRRTGLMFLGAGLAWGLAIAFRLPLVLSAMLVAGAVVVWHAHRPLATSACQADARERRWDVASGWRCLAAHAGGGALAAILVLAHPAAAGYLRECIDAAVIWPLGLRGVHIPGPLAPSAAERLADFGQDLVKIGWLHAGAVGGLLFALRAGPGRAALVVTLWYLSAAVSTLTGWNHYAHYHYVMLAPACVAVGLLASCWTARRAKHVCAGLVLVTGLVMVAQNTKAYARARMLAARSEKPEMVRWLLANTMPDETVFFWISGRDAGLLREVNRSPAVRHFMARSYFDMDLALVEEWSAEFVVHPPDYVVEETGIRAPQLFGAPEAVWELGIPGLRRIREFVSRCYRLEQSFGNFNVWRRQYGLTKSWKRHTIDASARGADGVRAADVDEDGRLELVSAWEESGIVRVYRNPGRPNVRRTWPAVTVGHVDRVEDAFFVDLDGDGAMDVVSCSESASRGVSAHWGPRDPASYFEAPAWRTLSLAATQGRESWMFGAPLSKDDRSPVNLLIGSKGAPGSVGLLHAEGNPRDGSRWKYQRLCDAGWIMSLIPTDIDGDGGLDVLVSDRQANQAGIFWLQNPGPLAETNGPWLPHPVGAIGKEVMFIDATDFDGDGRTDVIAAAKPRNVIFMYQPDCLASPWPEHSVELPEHLGTSKAVRAGDIDMDGQLDVVVSCEDASGPRHGVVWLSRQPDASANGWAIHDISGPQGTKFDLIELMDVDEDGDLDVVTCEEHENLGVLWYENPVLPAMHGHVAILGVAEVEQHAGAQSE